MNILTEPLFNFTYDKVLDFLKGNYPEGVELDYKEDFPKTDKLAQLFSAFANTRGGVLIFGVKENRDNGRPSKADGVKDGHHDEYIAHVIGNIKPIPSYEYHKTDQNKVGNVFVLVRIFEGYETPYYPHNDSNVWIRTDTIKQPVEIASPEMAELLYKKSERAMIGRDRNSIIAESNFKAFIDNAEKERIREIEIEKDNYELKKRSHEDGNTFPPFKSSITQGKLGSSSSLLKILLQPYFPRESLIRPLDIETILQTSRFENKNGMWMFPYYQQWTSTSEGMVMFNWARNNGEVFCQQVFANGLIYSAHDVLRQTEQEGKFTHLSWFAAEIYTTLKGAYNVLSKLGYQGTLMGTINVDGLMGVVVYPVLRRFFDSENLKSIFDSREWKIKIDTKTLSDDKSLQSYVTELVRDIHWSFGYKDLQKNINTEYLLKEGYIS